MGQAWVTEDRWNSREKQSDLGVHCLYTIIGLFDRQIVFVRMSVLIWIQTITPQREIIWTKKIRVNYFLMTNLFMKLQNCNLIFVMDEQTDGRRDKPKSICHFNLFEVREIFTRSSTHYPLSAVQV